MNTRSRRLSGKNQDFGGEHFLPAGGYRLSAGDFRSKAEEHFVMAKFRGKKGAIKGG